MEYVHVGQGYTTLGWPWEERILDLGKRAARAATFLSRLPREGLHIVEAILKLECQGEITAVSTSWKVGTHLEERKSSLLTGKVALNYRNAGPRERLYKQGAEAVICVWLIAANKYHLFFQVTSAQCLTSLPEVNAGSGYPNNKYMVRNGYHRISAGSGYCSGQCRVWISQGSVQDQYTI